MFKINGNFKSLGQVDMLSAWWCMEVNNGVRNKIHVCMCENDNRFYREKNKGKLEQTESKDSNQPCTDGKIAAIKTAVLAAMPYCSCTHDYLLCLLTLPSSCFR